MVGTMCRLSRRGMTVVLSIHQPRYSIYKLFDTLMLLHDGECVYHGPAVETIEFFASASETLLFALNRLIQSCSSDSIRDYKQMMYITD